VLPLGAADRFDDTRRIETDLSPSH